MLPTAANNPLCVLSAFRFYALIRGVSGILNLWT